MTIEELLSIEPELNNIVSYVISINKTAKNQRVYWHSVWRNAKSSCKIYVGWQSRNASINKSEHWDLFHNYLKSLATNCK